MGYQLSVISHVKYHVNVFTIDHLTTKKQWSGSLMRPQQSATPTLKSDRYPSIHTWAPKCGEGISAWCKWGHVCRHPKIFMQANCLDNSGEIYLVFYLEGTQLEVKSIGYTILAPIWWHVAWCPRQYVFILNMQM
jgi:hypothetical protein